MLDVKSRKWDSELLESLGLPSKILSTLVEPGVVIGSLTPEIQQDINISPIDVITVGEHDTASAVAAIPLRGQNCAYISSGTWSLLGIESSQPIISDQSFKYGFTNEGGVNKDYRFLKNTMGLWLLQRCRKKWSQQGNNFEYAELVQMADQAEPFYSVIDPDDASFLNPVDMPEAISKFCADTGQSIPKNPAQFTRIILESLAFKYRYVIDKINEMSENPINELHIVGGGSQNKLLNQITANVIGIPVYCGPVEATAIGNILMQFVAKGVIDNLSEGRLLVGKSIEQSEFLPQEKALWDDAYNKAQRFFNQY
jgi:sugar (pentulose or hexulose) kinase